MPIDQQTDRFKLDLPNEANTLKHDVARLIDSFNTLDEKAAKLDDDGHVSLDQLPDTIAKLTGAGFIKDEQIPTKVPLMDANGKLSISNIPEQALMTVFDAPSEVMMLELDPAPTIGDICNITTTPFKQYLLVKSDPTNRDSWRELPVRAVSSVNGNTGDVTVAAAGVNSDITSLTALSGPLKLGGKGQSGYDAVTFDQLVGAVGTSGGASMSGVMNNFIGAVEWFNGDRATIPAGYIPADGQLVSRTDPKTKDLWTAVEKGMFAKVSDSEWVAGPSAKAGAQYRGKYSTGDGSTTFRVPDLNGLQLNSIRALFLRGDGAGQATTTIGTVGEVLGSAAPNIVGGASFHGSSPTGDGGTALGGQSGAFTGSNGQSKYGQMNIMEGAPSVGTLQLDASRSSPVYGRANANLIDGANEVRPNSVTGIWLIRANGSFQAADTEFNVISSEAVEPPSNTTLHGGIVRSRLNVAGKTRVMAGNYANFVWGSAGGTASHNLDVVAYNSNGSIASNATYQFRADGQLTIPRGNTGYANLWSGAAVKILDWMASDGQENFQSFIAGSAATTNKGFYGGVSYGMMTTGGTSFPKAQISVAATDRDQSGNFSNLKVFRFSPTGDFETASIQMTGIQGMSWAECGNRSGAIWNPKYNIGTVYSFYSALSFKTCTPGGYNTTQHIGQIHGSASAFAQVCWGAWGDDDGKYNSRIQIGPNDGSITFIHADPTNPGGYNQTVNMTPASDITLKRDVQDYDGQQSLDNIEAMELKTFIFKNDVQNRVRRGVIAQQVEQIDPQYVKTRTYILGEGVERVQKELDSNVLLLDALAAIKVLAAQVKELKGKSQESI
ncbi:tail fiber domain-containing protein [Salmonella enterica]|nr:tail fiber domain-containing protein [Salmonella enterica]